MKESLGHIDRICTESFSINLIHAHTLASRCVMSHVLFSNYLPAFQIKWMTTHRHI